MLDVNIEPNLIIDLKIDDNTKDSIDKLSKPAYSVSQYIDDFGYLFFGGIHKKAEIKRIADESEIDAFRNHVNKITEQIPLEDQIPPRKSIIGPALQKAQFYFDESEIRDLFANLIANSIDINKSSKVHPSFPQVIENLSPLDAMILTSCFKKENIWPICEIRYLNGNQGLAVFKNLFMPPNFTGDYNLVSSSITNLTRIGLISTTYAHQLSDKTVYDKFLTNPIYLDFLNKANLDLIAKDLTKPATITVINGYAETTPFGDDFISVCC